MSNNQQLQTPRPTLHDLVDQAREILGSANSLKRAVLGPIVREFVRENGGDEALCASPVQDQFEMTVEHFRRESPTRLAHLCKCVIIEAHRADREAQAAMERERENAWWKDLAQLRDKKIAATKDPMEQFRLRACFRIARFEESTEIIFGREIEVMERMLRGRKNKALGAIGQEQSPENLKALRSATEDLDGFLGGKAKASPPPPSHPSSSAPAPVATAPAPRKGPAHHPQHRHGTPPAKPGTESDRQPAGLDSRLTSFGRVG